MLVSGRQNLNLAAAATAVSVIIIREVRP